jgi:hypothetical protein
MSDIPDTRLVTRKRPIRCPQCGHYVSPEQNQCDQCGAALTRESRTSHDTPTHVLTRPPQVVAAGLSNPDSFEPGATALLQFLPSGVCHTLTLKDSVILGRGTARGDDEFLDLSEFNAERHGVSRRHCQLRRRDALLLVTDLGSTNRTFLNDYPLEPHRDYVVSHGDKLILGSLHVLITFS